MQEKTQFKNVTDGWIGAVSIDGRNQQRGVAVEPGGTVWLSPEEEELTAHAPRSAEDNPFHPDHPQLVKVSEPRPVGSTRPIPSEASDAQHGHAAQEAATAEEPSAVEEAPPRPADLAASAREGRVEAQGPRPTGDSQPVDDADPIERERAEQEAAAADVTAVEGDTPSPPEQVGTPEAQQSDAEVNAQAKPSAAFTGAQEEVGTPEAQAKAEDEDSEEPFPTAQA